MNGIGNIFFTPLKEERPDSTPAPPKKEIKRSFLSSQTTSKRDPLSVEQVRILEEDSELVGLNLSIEFSRSSSWETMVILRTPLSKESPKENLEEGPPKAKLLKVEQTDSSSGNPTYELLSDV